MIYIVNESVNVTDRHLRDGRVVTWKGCSPVGGCAFTSGSSVGRFFGANLGFFNLGQNVCTQMGIDPPRKLDNSISSKQYRCTLRTIRNRTQRIARSHIPNLRALGRHLSTRQFTPSVPSQYLTVTSLFVDDRARRLLASVFVDVVSLVFVTFDVVDVRVVVVTAAVRVVVNVVG